jgi:nicotinate-nucleotide--dimethylbenzimidazole phosphoribosyltransferase
MSVATDIAPLDEAAMSAARQRLDRLTKPVGSLGRLERLLEQLAGITGSATPRIERPAVVVFAGDHGVTAQGVSAYPSDVTAQMVANFVDGGAAINVLARAAGAELVVVDVGVAGRAVEPSGGIRLVQARVRSGTRDMTVEPAMTGDEALAAIGVGREVVRELIAGGCDAIALGEMGIGNTTAASAIVAALIGRPPAEVTGRGTGLDDDAVHRKAAVIATALQRHHPRPDDPLGALAAVGGLEIAALVGAMLDAGEARLPVVLDGFITGAAALVAVAIAPNVGPRLIASHRSSEPGHRIALERLGLEPLLDLELRLGEGSGAALALPIIRAATLLLSEMATFDSARISGPSEAG